MTECGTTCLVSLSVVLIGIDISNKKASCVEIMCGLFSLRGGDNQCSHIFVVMCVLGVLCIFVCDLFLMLLGI